MSCSKRRYSYETWLCPQDTSSGHVDTDMVRIAAIAVADIFAELPQCWLRLTVTLSQLHLPHQAATEWKIQSHKFIQLFCSRGTASGGMPPGADYFQAAAAFDRRLEP